jgi:probable HAF family extracellular repeat protein
MCRTMMTGLALMTLAVSPAGVARPARAGIDYTLRDLGTLGGLDSFGQAVNASGQVAGDSTTAGGETHAFLSGPGGGPLTDLGTLGGVSSLAKPSTPPARSPDPRGSRSSARSARSCRAPTAGR